MNKRLTPLGGAALRLQQGITIPGLRRVDIEVSRNNVVVSGQHDGRSSRVEFSRVGVQALEPSKLVIEIWTGLGVSIGSVNRGDEQAVNGRLEIPALPVGRIARQVHASHNRSPSRKNRDAVPALLAAAYRLIARLPDCLRRELGVRGFEFLKTHDVGLGFTEPRQKVAQATIDVVNVETGDLHRFRRERSQRVSEKSLWFSRDQPTSGQPPNLTRRVVTV